MTAVWPSSVTQYADPSSLTEKPERNAVEFAPEVGPPMSRRRTSLSSDLLTFSTPVVSQDQYDDLIDFYRNDVKDGVLPFTRKHPRNVDGPSKRFRFAAEPQWRAVGFIYGNISLSLRLLS